MKLNIQNLLYTYFPRSYVCAMGSSGVVRGCILEDHNMTEELEKFKKMNDNGLGIFFTPNGIHDEEKRHALENLENINAWYIDIDIQETKLVQDESAKRVREDRKADIRGSLWYSPLGPSLTIENRNGFHCYWFTHSATQQNFKKIEMGIYHYFEKQGADLSSTKIITLLRVPGFYNTKNDEKFKIVVDPHLSSYYEDYSLKAYTEEEMIKAFPYEEPKIKVYKPPKLSFNLYGSDDIFAKVHTLPVEQVLNILSGHAMVRGERFSVKPTGRGKLNIFVDNKPTSNFIDTQQNHIYGKSGSFGNGPTITQWLKYYGIPYAQIAETYKQLFNS